MTNKPYEAMTPDERIRSYYDRVKNDRERYGNNRQWYMQGEHGAILTVLNILGIRIEGVNDK